MAIPSVRARPSESLNVVPVGSVVTGDPIVTTNRATLMVYNLDGDNIPQNTVWVLLATNYATFSRVGSISVSTGVTFRKSDFFNRYDSSESNRRFPPAYSNTPVPEMLGTKWLDLIPGYPGCESDSQYEVNSVEDKIGISHTESLYWTIKPLKLQAPVTDEPQFFTLTLNPTGHISNLKILVMVLGFGHSYPNSHPWRFNIHSPCTRKTLTVPEPSSILLAIAPIAALGLYKGRHKLKLK